MKTHSTNYFDTFIEVAEDTKATSGTKPPSKTTKSIAEMQYNLIAENPYQYTSDDVIFQVFAERNNLEKSEYEEARASLFSKGQACFRASPLTKIYGFGIHCNSKGQVAFFGMETDEYQKFLNDSKIKKTKAMKSRR